MYDVFKEVCFTQKNLYKWTQHEFVTMNLNQKTISVVEIYQSSSNVLGAMVSKEGHPDSVMRHEKTHHLISFSKCATVNSASNCQLFL